MTEKPIHGNLGGNPTNLTLEEMKILVKEVEKSIRSPWYKLGKISRATGVQYRLLKDVKTRLVAGELPFKRRPIVSERKPFSEHLNRPKKPVPEPVDEAIVNPEPVAIGQDVEGASHVDDVQLLLERMKKAALTGDMSTAVEISAISQAIDTLKKMGVHEEVGPPKPLTREQAMARLRIIKDCVGVELFKEVANERVA